MVDKLVALRGAEAANPPASDHVDIRNHLLFEVCSEVGRRVGGVHTVLKTKAAVETREYGDRYTLIGRLECASAPVEFDELPPPSDAIADTMEALRDQGVKTLYGKWLVRGSPRVLLLDLKAAAPYLEVWRREFEAKAEVSVPVDDDMANDAILFGYLSNWFFQEFLKREKTRAVIAQYHEWRSALGCFLARDQQLPMATIFTAHATVLGRDLCDRGVDLYGEITKLDAESEAARSPVVHRHVIERLAAHAAGALTTVSNITSLECEHLLGRAADVVLPNGMDEAATSVAGQASSVALRHYVKAKIRDFLHGHFYGQLDTFNADSALYFFLAGRYEYVNKGADMYIDALARLNEKLIRNGEGRAPSVVAFIIMPAGVESVSTEALHRQATVKTIEETVRELERSIKDKLRERALVWKKGNQLPTESELITEEDHALLRRTLYGIQTHDLPPLTTHNIINRRNDPIIKHLHRVNLRNRPEDKVKVVFHPQFLNPSSSVFPIDYDSFVRGVHLGVFPSSYEPWGYTPAECLVKGVPAVTTNVTGFGNHMEGLLKDVSAPEHGLYIVDRRNKTYDEAVEQMADYMYGFCKTDQRERVEQRNTADKLSEFLDWKVLHANYGRARDMALKARYGRKGGAEEKERPRMPLIKQRSELSLSFAPTPARPTTPVAGS